MTIHLFLSQPMLRRASILYVVSRTGKWRKPQLPTCSDRAKSSAGTTTFVAIRFWGHDIHIGNPLIAIIQCLHMTIYMSISQSLDCSAKATFESICPR